MIMELKTQNPDEFVKILGSLLQMITKSELTRDNKLDEKKCESGYVSLELGIRMAAFLTKADENTKMLDAFIVILCNLI